MPTYVIVGAVVGVILGLCSWTLQGDPSKEAEPDRIARLSKQLGDNAFRKREAASKELEAIGEPAVAALRKAAASSDDIEIRLRAERLIAALRLRLEAEELKKWQGEWTLVARTIDGKDVGKDTVVAKMLVVGNTFTYASNGDWKSPAFSLSVNPKEFPRQFQATYEAPPGEWCMGRRGRQLILDPG
jgi:uncharacterized protein (TIGR03067 family)